MRPDKVLSMLGIAAKSGSVVSGEFSTEKAVKEGSILPSPIDVTVLKQLVEATQVMTAQISQMQAEMNRQREYLF